MSKKDQDGDIKEFSADELLAELRARERGPKLSVAVVAMSMDKSVKQTTLAGYSTQELTKELRNQQKVIYGIDDRMDYYQIPAEQVEVKHSANGVACLVDMADLDDNGDGTSTMRTVSFKNAQQLCDGEIFANQPTKPFCSGFLVGKQLLATAGHCIDGNNLTRTRFVFGFRMTNFNTPIVTIPNSDIYSATAIVARRLESDGADYAVVKLDRPTTGRTILPLRRTGKIDNNESVYVIGHPSGLPLKFAPDARVRGNDKAEFFVANLDTYGGNSGSPVFNEDTHVVEGILVRGETDFVLNGTCRVSNVCPTNGCRGEDVTRTTEFANFVPEEDGQSSVASSELGERVERLETAIAKIAKTVNRIEKKMEK